MPKKQFDRDEMAKWYARQHLKTGGVAPCQKLRGDVMTSRLKSILSSLV